MSASTIQTYDADPTGLLKALLTTIEEKIIPLTSKGVASGSKLFGAAILSKDGLVTLTVATNNEAVSPLLHGEINCIQQFFAQTSFPALPHSSSQESEKQEGDGKEEKERRNGRPNPRDCIFLATHEPCSLCLSGITWSGFDNFFYLFTYEDSRDLFSIPYDIDVLQEVFRVPAVPLSTSTSSSSSSSSSSPSNTNISISTSTSNNVAAGTGSLSGAGNENPVKEDIEARPLYNRKNKFFTSRSLADLVCEIVDKHGEEEGGKWGDEVRRVKDLYNGLSDTYQKGKTGGVETASFWK